MGIKVPKSLSTARYFHVVNNISIALVVSTKKLFTFTTIEWGAALITTSYQIYSCVQKLKVNLFALCYRFVQFIVGFIMCMDGAFQCR